MPVEELLDFCAKREVEIRIHYDFICDIVFVEMRKKNRKIEATMPRDVATSGGFGLTARIILRGMADELDGLCVAPCIYEGGE